MYLHPHGITPELIDRICGSGVIAHYFDMSLQHVAPRVLKRMGRWGSRARFEAMIDRVRSLDPLAGIRATFILGFPGEADGEAAAVRDFVSASDLDWIGVFTYSREEGTRSHGLDDQVPAPTARARTEEVAAAAEIAMARRARSLAGTALEVLVERLDVGDGVWIGRSEREAPEVDGEIRFTTERDLSVGDYAEVVITGSDGADLVGRAPS